MSFTNEEMDKMFKELRDAMLNSPNPDMREYGKKLALIINRGEPLRTVEVSAECKATATV